MARISLACILLVTICTSAWAEQSNPPGEVLPWAHLAFTILGMMVAMRLALQAFGRQPIQLADVPTIPKYMTSQGQYRLANYAFAIFAAGIFLLLVYEHKQVTSVASMFGEGLAKDIIKAIENQSAPYLVVIAAMGAVYLYLLRKEAPWNVLLMMRDVIQTWISIPQLASDIVAQIKFSLTVPKNAVVEIVHDSTGVAEQDFYKDRNTLDRVWAEICYMKWWLTNGQVAGEDSTFFGEESFGFDKLLDEFNRYASAVDDLKTQRGSYAQLTTEDLFNRIKELHRKLSRLVACYLIYRNASREKLYAEANDFGIVMSTVASKNPLQYSIVYILALVASVYIGVHASAILHDLIAGNGLVFDQNSDRVTVWMMYSAANFGFAIVVILLLRWALQSTGRSTHRSHLIVYCWTFAVAFLAGPFGLAVAVNFFGPEHLKTLPFVSIFGLMLKWGLGPALVSVYISYYLDRQICSDLPDIDHSYSTLAWRLLNVFGFAAITVFLLLPPLMALTAPPGSAWDTDKLRFVAIGTTFMVAFGLALAAQFALRGGTEHPESVLTPRLSS